MTIRACRACGSSDLNKVPGGELGRENFHCKSCGRIGDPRVFETEEEHSQFVKSIHLSRKGLSKISEETGWMAYLERNYKKIVVLGLIAVLLFFIIIATVLVYMLIKSSLGAQANETTTTALSCEPPFESIGGSCCVDANKNRVCDIAEVAAQTTAPTTTALTTVETTVETTVTTSLEATTSAPTTTLEPTTTLATTSLAVQTVACTRNSDCGTEKTKYVCQYNTQIYEIRETPICYNPGTEKAMCRILQTSGDNPMAPKTPVLTCYEPKKCVQGEKRCE